MTTPPTDPIQPWWAKPGGAPAPGAAPLPPPYPPQPPHRPPATPPPPLDPNRYRLPPQPPTSHRAPGPSKGPNILLLGGIAAAVVVFAIAAGVGIWAWKFHDATVIDVAQAEAGVRQILSDPINGYGANTISALRCNGGKNPSADKGDSFTCDVEINGAVRHVTAVFQDDKGTFAVDGPR